MNLNLFEFEDLESSKTKILSYLEECRLQSVCPMCAEPYSDGVGTGRQLEGVYCSLECCSAFLNKYDNLLNPGRLN